jgi:hypothetical protein
VGSLSFYYTSIYSTGKVTIFAGENSTGEVLATVTLPKTPSQPVFDESIIDNKFAPFYPVALNFTGVGHSVLFESLAPIYFDDISMYVLPPSAHGFSTHPTEAPSAVSTGAAVSSGFPTGAPTNGHGDVSSSSSTASAPVSGDGNALSPGEIAGIAAGAAVTAAGIVAACFFFMSGGSGSIQSGEALRRTSDYAISIGVQPGQGPPVTWTSDAGAASTTDSSLFVL